jgi:hypothetical protein
MQQVKDSRAHARLSQRACADLIYVSRRAWQTYEDGTVAMKVGLWELFQFKTGQFSMRQTAVTPQRGSSKHPGRPQNLKPYAAQE